MSIFEKNRERYRIFLGGYVNEPNAQNINCDCIARYIDKNRFDVHICYDSTIDFNKAQYETMGVHLHKVVRHRFLDFVTKYIALVSSNCELYYLPKREKADILFAKRHSKKILVGTVEGNALSHANNNDFYRNYYLSTMNNSYAISKSVAKNAKIAWGVELDVIPLGTELQKDVHSHTNVNSICWVGSVSEHKRPLDLIEIARFFPNISFYVIGKGNLEREVRERISAFGLKNVTLTGQLPNHMVYETMKKCDLLLMTSEYEGLPKVIQEAAACGLPSIYINNNYDVDLIIDGVNGYGVSSVEEIINKVRELVENTDQYQLMSRNAIIEIQKYGWPQIVNQIEKYYRSLIKERRDERIN